MRSGRGARSLSACRDVRQRPWRVRAGQRALRPEVLRDGQLALAERHSGARFQYVFHGSSGSEPNQVREAIANGVVKINLDTDGQYAFTRAIADHLFTNYDGVLRSTATSAASPPTTRVVGAQGRGGARAARRRRQRAVRREGQSILR